MFWYNWSSWVVEITGGAALGIVAAAAVGPMLGLVVATFVSIAYEVLVDPNLGQPGHEMFKDITQREVGIVLGALLMAVL